MEIFNDEGEKKILIILTNEEFKEAKTIYQIGKDVISFCESSDIPLNEEVLQSELL